MEVDVIVTGAAGFIGQALCLRLRLDGRNVLAVTREHGDITSASLWESMPQAKAVVHLAARSYVPDSWKDPSGFVHDNVLGCQRALEWSGKHGAHLVYSSAYVYGIPNRLPIRESEPVVPNNPYALSKYLAEQCCEFATRYQGVDATVLRLFNVFGPGQREEFLFPTLIRQLEGSEIRVMDLAPKRDYVYLDDVVDAFFRAIDRPQGFARMNIGSGVSYSVADIVATLQAAAGTNLPVVSMSEARPQEIPDVCADITLAETLLGWRPANSLERGIQKILNGVTHE